MKAEVHYVASYLKQAEEERSGAAAENTQAECGDREKGKHLPSLWGSPQDPSGRVHSVSGRWNRLRVESPEPPTEGGQNNKNTLQYNAIQSDTPKTTTVYQRFEHLPDTV